MHNISGVVDGEDDTPSKQIRYDNDSRPWFFADGVMYPKKAKISNKTGHRIARVLPDEEDPSGTIDRVLEQLMFIPPNSEKKKVILFYNVNVLSSHKQYLVDEDFRNCPVNTCTAIFDTAKTDEADLIVYEYFNYGTTNPFPVKSNSPNQLHLIHLYESSANSPYMIQTDDFNWTSSYK